MLVPTRPRNACPVCRRAGCTDPAHAAVVKRNKWRIGTREEVAYRKACVMQWVQVHGWVCPGYGRAAHESHDLTADHIAPLGKGGDPFGPVQILCRSCNSRRGQAMQG